jgi:pre-rRNA-processing protein TSR3
MGSSGSTPSPPRRTEVPLLIVLADEDDPRRCSGRRLLRAGAASELPVGRPPASAAVLLDPHSDTPLSRVDRPAALRAGVVAVDCSWNRIGRHGRYPREIPWLARMPVRRRLPWLLAANPQHHGRLAELNTAEALAGSLLVLGEPDRARRILAGFAGGDAFFDLNAAALRAYAQAVDAEGIRAAESAQFSAPAPHGSAGPSS